MKVGIPRALLYHSFGEIWVNFLGELGLDYILSPETNKEIVKRGIMLSVDESCFSSKVYLGAVDWLIPRCDVIFAPRYEIIGFREDMCPRIFGMWDVTKRTFPTAKFLHADINVLQLKRERDAFVNIGEQLGFDKEKSLHAYETAVAKFKEAKLARLAKQETLLNEPGLKILIVGHSYNVKDAHIGRGILDFFAKNEIAVIHAGLIDPCRAKQKTRVYWTFNADLLDGIEKYKDFVDGIVLVTTFPCGPDSIFNELVLRTIKDKPILSLMVDELDATAGLQTRLESFVDILQARSHK